MRLISLTLLALRRLANQRALTACLLLGMTVAVAIASAIPAFVSSAQNRVLRRELADRAAGQIRLSGLAANTRLPLSLKFSYLGFGRALLNFDETRELDTYMAERVAPRLGLPVVRTVRYMSTDLWTILPANETWRKYPLDDSQPLGYASLDFMTDLLDHIDLDAGRLPAGFPGAPPVTDDGEIEVMVGRGFSAKTGIQAGDAISLTRTETTLVASDLKTSREYSASITSSPGSRACGRRRTATTRIGSSGRTCSRKTSPSARTQWAAELGPSSIGSSR